MSIKEKLRGVLIFLVLLTLVGLTSCKTTSTTLYESNNIIQVYVKDLPIDSVIMMFKEDVLLVKTQDDFTYLISWYRQLVTKRLIFTEYEQSLFFYIIEEEAQKLNYKL